MLSLKTPERYFIISNFFIYSIFVNSTYKAGVSGMITVSEFSSDAEKILQLAKKFIFLDPKTLSIHV